MEIKTCEEYVLNELENAYNKNVLLESKIYELQNQLNRAKEDLIKLTDLINVVKKDLKIRIQKTDWDNYGVYVSSYSYLFSDQYEPEKYANVKSLFNLEEPEDDRADGIEESN